MTDTKQLISELDAAISNFVRGLADAPLDELVRRMARAVVYADGGKCYFVKVPYSGALPGVTQRVKAKHPNALILNTMPIDKAVDLYLETAG